MRRKKYPNGYRAVPEGTCATCGCTDANPCRDSEGKVACSWSRRDATSCSRCVHTRRTKVSDRSDTLVLKGAEGWVKPPAKVRRKKSPAATPKQVEQAVAGFQEVSATRSWEAMKPSHFLGLYVACHRRVYGVDPTDLFAQWVNALFAVRSILCHEFGGDESRMVAFLRWAWAREQSREKQRGAEQSYRLGWKLLFVRQAAAGILTDYRTQLARAARSRAER